MFDTPVSVEQNGRQLDRRQALKIAAGAVALGAVLGAPPREAVAALQGSRLTIKMSYAAGGKELGAVELPQDVIEFLLRGDLTSYKESWWAWGGRDERPALLGTRPLDSQVQNALMEMRG
jgi:hypothetical protein